MKQWMVVGMTALLLVGPPVAAAETPAKPAADATQPVPAKSAKPAEDKSGKQEPAKKEADKNAAAKKEPGAMEKTGNSVKSGWHKFTRSVKQGRKKPACTPAQKSLKQC